MSFTLKNLSPTQAARSQSGLQRVIIAVALAAAVGGGSVSIVSPARSDVALRLAPTVMDISGTDLALSGVLFAQAGSVGGSVAPPAAGGREGKSISGGEPAVQAPPPAAKAEKRPPARESRKPVQAKRRATAGESCRSIVGTWSSGTSGQPTQFNSDRTITRPGSKGTWSCENGQYTVVWRYLGRRGPFRLSADGKQLITKDGSVSFYRDGGAPQKTESEVAPETPASNEKQNAQQAVPKESGRLNKQPSQKVVTGEATSPPGAQGAKCTYAMDRSAEKACARCKKEIGATASCTRAHGGCNAKGQYGGLAYGLDYEKNWGALGSKVQDTRSLAYAASDAIKACNQSAEKRGASCKLVRTWGEGCQYIIACCKSLQQ